MPRSFFFYSQLVVLLLWAIAAPSLMGAQDHKDKASAAQTVSASQEGAQHGVEETDAYTNQSIFARAWQGGLVVFTVLITLLLLSILAWAIGIAKMLYLKKVYRMAHDFIKTFWDSRSLNELNSRLNEYPYSPAREIFRSGYAELVRVSQLRDQATGSPAPLVIQASLDNLQRSLNKAKNLERRKLERFLPFLAICASVAPFIGLFGTVWGIMGAFEGIARSGSASLAAVAPGIAEALIATAFGLAAAIPAAVAYNVAHSRIRMQMIEMDGFSSDFINIVERYLVSDKGRHSSASEKL